MVRLELTEQDASTLREVLEDVLGDLRMEVADTDRKDFRDRLKETEELLKRVIAGLRG